MRFLEEGRWDVKIKKLNKNKQGHVRLKQISKMCTSAEFL
jgi:hypothetical protein